MSMTELPELLFRMPTRASLDLAIRVKHQRETESEAYALAKK